ncbi:MAG: 3-keto-5-aminohexanoate cleavage protein [Hyphomicrobiales bacterium]
MAEKKLVVLAAVNGGAQQNRNGAQVPTQPAELAEEAYRCYQAGASVIHIHARGKDKGPTADIGVFSDIIRRIKDKCDVLVQTTNGIGIWRDPATGRMTWPTDEQRLALLTLEPKQDLFSLAGGSWDFYHPEGGYPGDVTFVNTVDLLKKNIPPVLARGASIEFEITELGFISKLSRLADEGVFDRESPNFWLDYCFGFGGIPSTPRMLINAVDEGRRHFPKAKWEVLATGKEQFSMNTIGVLMGCDIVRVGFEDSIHLPNGTFAQHNHQMVEAMVRIAREFGREPTTVAEARKVFSLKN